MRVYSCMEETGILHWHVTKMSKGRYYTSKRKDPRVSRRASRLPR